MQLPHQGKAAHSRDALGRERDTYAAGVEDDLILHAKNAAYSPVKRGQKDCGDDDAVGCQDQPKATGLCINPG